MEPCSQVSPLNLSRRPSNLSHISDPDVLSGNDPPTGTLIQRCGETGILRETCIRVLCPPCARPFYREATTDADSSGLSASLVSLHVVHEFTPRRCRHEAVLASHTPLPAQIGVFPQSDQTPDHEPSMRHQSDVGHAQDHATPVSATVIPLQPMDARNAF